MKGTRAQTLLYLLTALVLAVSLSILVWLRARYEADRQRSLAYMQSLFTRDEVIKPPQDINIRFGQIEQLARKSENTLFARRVCVAKIIDGVGEHPVYPFYLPLIHPDWRAAVAGWTRLPLAESGGPFDKARGGGEYGALYVDENRAALQSVQWAIGGLAALLVVTLGLGAVRLGVQQTALAGAHVALAEKERQLIRLERLALVGQLSANIFHDIKKPVINIQNSAGELESALRESPASADALRDIQNQTGLFLSILRDLGLERFVRSNDAETEYCDVHDILRQSCALVRYEKKDATEIEWDLDKSATPLVLAPHYRLIQVFSNLILNAYQAMAAGAQTDAATGAGVARLTLRSRIAGGRIAVEVRDTGPGVPPEMRARLFEPFESSKPEGQGAGLGLYIARSIVENLGGSLRLADAPAGACFIAELPLAS